MLAFQSVSGLRDPKLYGQFFADEILGQIGNRFIGRLECVTTAEWASSLFGDQEVMGKTETKSSGPGGASSSVSRQPQVRRMVLPGELMSIPACDRENGLSGYYIVRSAGVFFDTLPGVELFDRDSTSPVAGFEPRPPEAQLLRPWSKEEQARWTARRIKKSPQPELESEHEHQHLRDDDPSRSLDDLDSLFD